jgi:hypothetical protein
VQGSVPSFPHLSEMAGPDAEERILSKRPAVIRPAFARNVAGQYPDAGRPGTVLLQSRALDEYVMDVVIPKAIVSANAVRTLAGCAFSFTVTTTGCPVPSLTKKGALPDNVGLVDNGDGTATLSGTPETDGDYRITLKAKFDKRAAKYVAVQTFTLTVAVDQ